MIVPIVDTIQSKIVRFLEVELVQYNINQNAVCNVNYLDASGLKFSSVLVSIEGDDFNTNWTTDQDLINIVLSKLGLQLGLIPTP